MSELVTAEWPAEDRGNGAADVRLTLGSSELFRAAAAGARMLPEGEAWYRHAFLEDGRVYLRWEGLFQFLVAEDGRQMWCGSLGAETMESFQVCLLGHALGFALTLMGEEPLHATVVAKEGRAVGLLGDCGAGWRLVTDD